MSFFITVCPICLLHKQLINKISWISHLHFNRHSTKNATNLLWKVKLEHILLHDVSDVDAVVVEKTPLGLNRGCVRGCWLLKSSLALGLLGGPVAPHVIQDFYWSNLTDITVFLVFCQLLLQIIGVFSWYFSRWAWRRLDTFFRSVKNNCGLIRRGLTHLNLVTDPELTIFYIFTFEQTSRLSCQARSIFWNSREIRAWWLRKLVSNKRQLVLV